MRSSAPAARATRAPEGGERQSAEAGPPSSFDVAAARAMARYSPAEWALLEPSQRTEAIYAELRRLDSALRRQGG